MMKHTITVPDAMSEYISGQVKNGMYGNVSEYFRDLVRKDQERKQIGINELRKLVDEGEASGTTSLSLAEIREEARKELKL